MSTSGTYNYTLTRNDIIRLALQGINAIELTDAAIPQEQQEHAEKVLNLMIKEWEADYIGIWKTQSATLFLQYGTRNYELGPTGTHCTKSYTQTNIATAAISGASSIIVDSASGLTIADYIGVELDDNTLQWFTISGIAGTTITLSGTLTDSVAVDNIVYAYTTKIQRPLYILDDVTKQYINNNDIEIPLTRMTRVGYNRIPYKTQISEPFQFYYDKQMTNGVLYIYPVPGDVTKVINFSFKEPLQSFDAAANTPDFPDEWGNPLVTCLKAKLGSLPSYAVPADIQALLNNEAAMALDKMRQFDLEGTGMNLKYPYFRNW